MNYVKITQNHQLIRKHAFKKHVKEINSQMIKVSANNVQIIKYLLRMDKGVKRLNVMMKERKETRMALVNCVQIIPIQILMFVRSQDVKMKGTKLH